MVIFTKNGSGVIQGDVILSRNAASVSPVVSSVAFTRFPSALERVIVRAGILIPGRLSDSPLASQPIKSGDHCGVTVTPAAFASGHVSVICPGLDSTLNRPAIGNSR